MQAQKKLPSPLPRRLLPQAHRPLLGHPHHPCHKQAQLTWLRS